MKKRSLRIALSAALIGAALPVIAYEECPFSGFYGGVQVGGSFVSGRETVGTSGVLSTGTPPAPLVPAESINTFSDRGFRKNSVAGDIFLGYGCSAWDPVYLGAEIFLRGAKATTTNLDDANMSLSTAAPSVIAQDIATQVRTRLRPWEFGIDARPGVLLREDFLLYGRVGVAFNRLSVTTSTAYTVSTTAGAVTRTFPANSLVVNSHRNIGALRLGLGVEKEICENLTLRTDYTYSRYRKVNTSGTQSIATLVPILIAPPITFTSTASNNTSTRAVSHSLMVGLSYYW